MATISELSSLLSDLSTKEDKTSALYSYLEAQGTETREFSVLLPSANTPRQEQEKSDSLAALVSKHGLQDVLANICSSPELLERITGKAKPKRGSEYPPPIQRLGCANYDIRADRFCPEGGTQTCARCSLVKYCSKNCQVEHWRFHKLDCKNSLNSKTWRPDWIVNERTPQFHNLVDNTSDYKSFGMGMSLWGNMPAIDVLKLAQNEGKDKSKNADFSLAFVACGDLRNVIRTVNELPNDYSGTLSLLLNDHNPITISRNLVLVLILTALPDLEEAAEHALHFWYSAFLPLTYTSRVLPRLLNTETLKRHNTSPVQVTESTTLRVHFDDLTWTQLVRNLGNNKISPSDASNAFIAVMKSPHRVDFAHRTYLPLKPPHRLAIDHWRTYGLFLPFGEPNHHMNLPNPWLFSKADNGAISVYLKDSKSPLSGWVLDSVMAAGKEHGVTEFDLMGCGFFYVKDQLLEFARRLKKFKIDISLHNQDALRIPAVLSGFPSAPKTFDRVEVSNIVDSAYCGIGPVLEVYGPLLNKKNSLAAIIGLFMNWTKEMPAGSIFSAGREMKDKMSQAALILRDRLPRVSEAARIQSMAKLQGKPEDNFLTHSTDNLDAFLENSKEFFAFLSSKKVQDYEQKVGLKMRQINRVVSPRLHTPLGSKHSAIVDVTNDEAWYRFTAIDVPTYLERYVEWQLK